MCSYGKIDFIVCEEGGGWYITSLKVPIEIAKLDNKFVTEWAKNNHFLNEPGLIFVSVYWRDDAIMEQHSGIMPDAVQKMIYKKNSYHTRVCE
jgi:hypothetical protein